MPTSSGLALDVARVQAFAQTKHGRYMLAERSPSHRADPVAVGLRAAGFARIVTNGDFGDEAVNAVAVATCSGLLVYGMECWGLTYEAVCDVAAYPVASVLTQISPNITLNPALRNNDLRSKVTLADPLSQAVKLAEIFCSVQRVLAADPVSLKARAADLKRYVDDQGHVVAAITNPKVTKRLVKFIDKTKLMLAQAAVAVERARRLTDPHVLPITTRLVLTTQREVTVSG